MVRTTSVAVTPSGMEPVSLKPTTRGDEHGDRLSEHGRLGFNAADAPAEHAQSH